MPHSAKKLAQDLSLETGQDALKEAILGLDTSEAILQVLEPLLRELSSSQKLDALPAFSKGLLKLPGLPISGIAKRKRAIIFPLRNDFSAAASEMIYHLLRGNNWDLTMLSPLSKMPEIKSFIELAKPDAAIVVSTEEDEKVCAALKKMGPTIEYRLKEGLSPFLNELSSLFPEGDICLDILLQSVGREVRARRKSLKLSQTELADKTDTSRAFISSLENGKNNVSLGNLLKVSQALETSIINLLRNT